MLPKAGFAIEGGRFTAIGESFTGPAIDLGGALTTGPVGAKPEARNYLIVGSDSRAKSDPTDPDYATEGIVGGQRSDTIMVVRLDPSAGTVTMLSLPRDLLVKISGFKRPQRINAAFNKGPDVLVTTIRNEFGIPIHHYVQIDFQAFKKLVDALNGVKVYFDQPVRDGNTGLAVPNAGCHTLNGVQALAYARSRHLEYYDGKHWHSDGTADLGRISRQQDFMRRALAKAVEKASSNPLGVAPVVDAVTSNVVVDKGLSNADLLSLARHFSGFSPSALTTYTMPAAGKIVAGQSVLIADKGAAERVLALFADAATQSGLGALGLGETAAGAVAALAPPPAPAPVGIVGSQPCG